MNPSQPAEQRYVLVGRYDASRAADLERQLGDFFDAGIRRIVLDFSQVTYISSSILRVLVVAHRRASALGGEIVLENIPPPVMRILHLVGLDRILPIEPTSPSGE